MSRNRVIYYLATSLDGFIADRDGGVDWLFGDEDEDYGYEEFFDSIGALLMGRVTYEQVLSFGGDWPYGDKPVWVVSRQPPEGEHPNAQFASDPAALIERLRHETDGDLWLVGGTGLFVSCRSLGLVDELILSIHPILLGDGIPLLPPDQERLPLTLESHRVYPSGLVQLRYRLTRPEDGSVDAG